MNASHIYSTDTDSKAIPGFLLGVIVALSVLFVALEFTSVTTPDVPDDSFDDMVQDMDLQSYADQRDMISADRPAVAASANIKAVEDPQTATPDKLASEYAPSIRLSARFTDRITACSSISVSASFANVR